MENKYDSTQEDVKCNAYKKRVTQFMDGVDIELTSVNYNIVMLQKQLEDARKDKQFWQNLVFRIVIISMCTNTLGVIATCSTMLCIYFVSLFVF